MSAMQCQTSRHHFVFVVTKSTGWSKKEDITLKMVTLSVVERFPKCFHCLSFLLRFTFCKVKWQHLKGAVENVTGILP